MIYALKIQSIFMAEVKMVENYNFKKGDAVLFGEGEWEDYTEFGHRVALKNFNLQEQATSYLKDKGGYNPDKTTLFDFLEWLDKQGFTSPLKFEKIFCGAGYSKYDFDFFGLISSELRNKMEQEEIEKEEAELENLKGLSEL